MNTISTLFPPDHLLNIRIDGLPVHSDSDAIMDRFRSTWTMALFSNKPYNIVNGVTPVPVTYTLYGKTTSPKLVPIPTNALFMIRAPYASGVLDNHAMFWDKEKQELFELWGFNGTKMPDGSYSAGSGWKYDLTSSVLPPLRVATAAASGISVLAGLARSEEILAGKINHALSMTTFYTSDGCIPPASSWQRKRGTDAEWMNPYNPKMGTRIRLNKNFDISKFGPHTQVILTAAKEYGLIVTDGSKMSGTLYSDPNPNLNVKDLFALRTIPYSVFEVVSA